MTIGLIDVDGHRFPNLPLMKLSAWHKKQGDFVKWYEPLADGFPNEPLDRVYMSKVFSFTPDYEYHINAKEVIKGGSGYCIELVNGREVYCKSKDKQLPPEIEHIYPDYSIYPELTKGTAFGYMSRGCPRGCKFCHVEAKEGRKSYKVADLSEFWKGQKNIKLCDPNTLACRDWKDILQQLIDSKSYVDFTQGVDIRLMTEEKADMIRQIKIKSVHFAWDRYEDKEKIVPKLKRFADVTKWNRGKMGVYMLTNFDTTIEQDLERVYTLRDLGYSSYLMIYDKEHLPKGHILRKMQRWVNAKLLYTTVQDFRDYK